MNDADKFKRHMRKPIEIEIVNKEGDKDSFKLTPLTNIDLIGFMNLCDKFSKFFRKPKNAEESRKALQDVPIDLWNEFFEYIKKSVKPAYPDIPNDVLDDFITNNFMQLYPEIIKLNTEINESKLPPEILKEIKENQSNEIK